MISRVLFFVGTVTLLRPFIMIREGYHHYFFHLGNLMLPISALNFAIPIRVANNMCVKEIK